MNDETLSPLCLGNTCPFFPQILKKELVSAIGAAINLNDLIKSLVMPLSGL